MPNARDLLIRAQMFSEKAECALDPASREHLFEMAAHYRMLAIEHQHIRVKAE